MVSKSKPKTSQKKSKVKVGKLVLNKESIKDLSGSERRRIKGAGFIQISEPSLPRPKV
jgi:hypothetical protein